MLFVFTFHADAKPYPCRHCSDYFTWPDQLVTHLLKSHSEGTWDRDGVWDSGLRSRNKYEQVTLVHLSEEIQYQRELESSLTWT